MLGAEQGIKHWVEKWTIQINFFFWGGGRLLIIKYLQAVAMLSMLLMFPKTVAPVRLFNDDLNGPIETMQANRRIEILQSPCPGLVPRLGNEAGGKVKGCASHDGGC